MSGPAAFPYALGTGGHTAVAAPHEAVAQMLEQILFVAPGERVNRPDFGCHLPSLTFSARGGDLTTAVRALVAGALRQWVGGAIEVRDVDVDVSEEVVVVTVRYVDPRAQKVLEVRVSN